MVRNGDKKGLCKHPVNKVLNDIDEPMIKNKNGGSRVTCIFMDLEFRII